MPLIFDTCLCAVWVRASGDMGCCGHTEHAVTHNGTEGPVASGCRSCTFSMHVEGLTVVLGWFRFWVVADTDLLQEGVKLLAVCSRAIYLVTHGKILSS